MKKFIDESWLVLVMGLTFAVLLAGTQAGLSDRIKSNETQALNEAISEVVPGVETKEELDIDGNKVFRCVGAGGEVVGWAIEAVGTGFVDKITLVCGLTADGEKITGVKVIKHKETPGLGNKIERKDTYFYPYQYDEKSTSRPFVLIKSKPEADNEIQAITGATYSSQYVMSIVNDIIERIRPKLAEQG